MSQTAIPSNPILRWLLILAVLLVAGFASLTVDSISHRARTLLHARVIIAQLELRAHQLNALEWEIIHKGNMASKLGASVAEARHSLQAAFDLLREHTEASQGVEELHAQFQDYTRELDFEFQMLSEGRIRDAEEQDELKVDPAFDRLSDTLREVSDRYREHAESLVGKERFWIYGVVFGAAGLLGFVFWLYADKRRVMEVSAAEQRALRQANLTLEARVAERTAELERLNRRIGIIARQAGMAEVANSVLHNLGNSLNSVNVSASLVSEMLAQSQLSDLPAAANLLEQHQKHLADFLTHDERGRLFPGFLKALGKQWAHEHQALVQEMIALEEHIRQIREIVRHQESVGGFSLVMEDLGLDEVVSDMLQANQDVLTVHHIEIQRQSSPGLRARADRFRLTQILDRLLYNAIQSLESVAHQPKLVSISILHSGTDRVSIVFEDRGHGFNPADAVKLFAPSGVLTRSGSTLDLHASAISVGEMGGRLEAFSEGLGLGSRFVVELHAAIPHETVQAA